MPDPRIQTHSPAGQEPEPKPQLESKLQSEHPPPPALRIYPPLLNSACPWATTRDDLAALLRCPATGAVTTRTALLRGFAHDDAVHRFVFFEVGGHGAVSGAGEGGGSGGGEDGSERGKGEVEDEDEGRVRVRDRRKSAIASMNTLGYSPIPLDEYLAYIEGLTSPAAGEGDSGKKQGKPFIISVTGSPADVAECYERIAALASRTNRDRTSSSSSSSDGTEPHCPLAMEINLSCPNIPGAPPPAYDGQALAAYLDIMTRAAATATTGEEEGRPRVPWGVKVPPYTHAGQFDMLVSALRGAGDVCPVSFVTATNTLGSCLLLGGEGRRNVPVLGGVGGMAGAALHPLALGNVATLRRLFNRFPETRHVQIVGVGGVEDAAGYRRMRDVGAAAVAVATALGRKGVAVFTEIEDGLRELAGGKGVVW